MSDNAQPAKKTVRWAQALPASCVLFAACLLNFGYFIFWNQHDVDEMYYVRSALVSPSQCEYTPGAPWSRGYAYAVDHPSVQRYVYGWALRATGVTPVHGEDVDYSRPAAWNIENGRVPSMTGVVIPLRTVNALFMTAAVMLVFLAAFAVLKRPYCALLVALPLVMSEHVCLGAVAYLGTDAILAFWFALSLSLTAYMSLRSVVLTWYGALVLGAIAGLALSTKLNGALALAAYCSYSVLASRGRRRLALPVVACLACAAVFVLLNPVMRVSLSQSAQALRDMLAVRRDIWLGDSLRWAVPRHELIVRMLPYGAFLFALAGAMLRLKKADWLPAVASWCLVVSLGTALTVNYAPKRYYVPVEIAVFFLAGVCAWTLQGEGPAGANGRRRFRIRSVARPAGAILASVALVALALVGYVTLERWGPTRLDVSVPATGRVALFSRQAASFYGLADPLSRADIRRYVPSPGRDESSHNAPAAPPRSQPDSLLDDRAQRILAAGVMALASWVIYMLAARLVSSRLIAVAVAGVFVFDQLTLGHAFASVSQSMSALSVVLCVFFLVSLRDCAGATSLVRLVALALSCAVAMAASPSGILATAAAVLCVASWHRGKTSILLASVLLCVSLLCFPLIEQFLRYVGGTSVHEFVYAVSMGNVAFRMGPYHGLTAFATIVRDVFPFLPMAPLAAVVFSRVSGIPSKYDVATWSAITLAGVMLALPDSSVPRALARPQLPAAACAALALGVALPGLQYLAGQIRAVRGKQ